MIFPKAVCAPNPHSPHSKTLARRILAASVLLACGFNFIAHAQLTGYEATGARSVSGQFTVHVEPAVRSFARAPEFANDANLIKLEAPLVITSCERIKQWLTGELGDKSQWRGKIFISLHPAQTADDEITFTTERFKGSWAYRLDVPNPVNRTRFVRAVVLALLQERANRNARDRSAEIPLWLTEGFAQQLLASRSREVFLVPPPVAVGRFTPNPSGTLVETRRTSSVAAARRDLGERVPLTLEALSWPKEDQLAGPDAAAYSQTARLFVAELLSFKDGRDCLRALLAELPSYLNWQTAFLRAFQPHFQRQLDVEKWWTLSVANRTGREAGATWLPEESWRRLDEMLRVSIAVRGAKTEMPLAAEVPLITVVRDWDFMRQTPVLRAKLKELDFARQRVAEEILPLVDDYRRVLANYLDHRGRAGLALTGARGNIPAAKTFLQDTLKQLEALEARRQEMKPAAAVSAAPTGSPPSPTP
ncbi:MAG: hypothetical protein EXS35_15260 [Pedosphaera sp.]|nr:hypothetical protein [Pedosphaera sp.]